VSGNGTTYTVTVSTGGGSGTIGLNLVDNDSIVNVNVIPLKGTGTTGGSNGSFTGEVYTVNSAPVAPNGTLTTKEDTASAGTLAATDADGNALTYTLVDTANAQGTVTITNASTGAYTYTPAADYFGTASFTFKANDGLADSNTATVSITVTP